MFRGALLTDSAAVDNAVIEVAVKRLAPGLDRLGWNERWQTLRQLLGSVHASGPIDLVRIVDVFEGGAPHRRRQDDREPADLYLLTEWIPGRRFDEWSRDGAVARAEREVVLGSLRRTIEKLHDHGVIHRDLAPGNIIVGDGRAVIIDVGLAVACPANGWITEAGVVGTDGYRSPEATSGRWSQESDRYALDRLTDFALDRPRPPRVTD